MVVCHCRRVNDRTITELATRANTTVEEISGRCGAGTDCGGCRDTIQQLLDAACAAARQHLHSADRLAGQGRGVNGSPGIIEFLNEALTAELTAINQYFAHAKLCQNWGWKKGVALALEHGDPGTRELLEHLVVGEEQHLDWIETQLRVVADVGLPLYLQAQLGD